MLWAAGTRLFMRVPAGWKCIRLAPSDGSLEVTSITAASGGGLWLGSSTNELWRYYPNGSVIRVAAGGDTQKVTVVLEQADGTVWFGGPAGLAALRGHDVLRITETEGLARGAFMRCSARATRTSGFSDRKAWHCFGTAGLSGRLHWIGSRSLAAGRAFATDRTSGSREPAFDALRALTGSSSRSALGTADRPQSFAVSPEMTA
jgi:hypothetical protein